jgi:hypothetical protein
LRATLFSIGNWQLESRSVSVCCDPESHHLQTGRKIAHATTMPPDLDRTFKAAKLRWPRVKTLTARQ